MVDCDLSIIFDDNIDHKNNKRETFDLEIGIGSILWQKICCASMIRDRISAKIVYNVSQVNVRKL